MKELQQGELDCLCGIYSIINAVYFVSNKKIKRKPLFNQLLLAYMNNWGIYDLLTNGLDLNQMKYLLNHTVKIHKQIKIEHPNIRLHSKIPSLISSHLKKQSNAIVLFSTNYHWSLIKGYDNEKLSLFDSCGINTVKFSEILPNSLFYISFLPKE